MYLNLSRSAALKSIINIVFDNAVFEKVRSSELYDFNIFVITYEQAASDYISPTSRYFSFFNL